ncbi:MULTISPECIES: GNAT family N-acetyltransferase [unclassified Dysgonomonas]|uniref:GNAT family N-acetyltransferase n=1 Tax=unclassified Dysgonomonas TaxID=2630389 RepID=UPI00067FEEDE|nr:MULTISPECIES: GNAT family protein [unclassified Dysgonomonas]MBD8348527.1 GNAT family N-acetyltransferase [Dysgonomonas sp. HGC4]MBF0575210.1 GNAT family N-acetyltransferase [Dysgonomonas sp. GY617]
MFLENDILKLRSLEPEDLDILYKWENNTNLWVHGNTLTPYSKLALRQYISETQQQDIYEAKQLRFMIELKATNTAIGTIDLYEFDFHHSRAGIGILIDENYRNNSYALQTLDLIKEYVFAFLHIKQIFAYITTDNPQSIRLFEKAGYKRAGELVDWVHYDSIYKNVYIYQLIRS